MSDAHLAHAGSFPDLESALAPAVRDVATVRLSAAAATPTRAALGAIAVEPCPVLRGRTVWDACRGASAVVESPNRYGRLEPAPPVPGVLVTTAGAFPPSWAPQAAVVRRGDRWHRLDRLGPPGGGGVPDFSGCRRRFEERTDAARRLARGLAQLRGVHLAFGDPESPVFVILVPTSPADWAGAAREDGPVGMSVPEIPGLPGGVRIEVYDDLSADDVTETVSRLAAASRRKRREASS